MAMAAAVQSAFRASSRLRARAFRVSRNAKTPLFQAFLRSSLVRVTDGRCIKDGTPIDPPCGTGGIIHHGLVVTSTCHAATRHRPMG